MQLGRKLLCLLCTFTDMTSEVLLRKPNKHIYCIYICILTNTVYSVLVHTLLFTHLMLSVVCEKYYKILKAWNNVSVVLHLETFSNAMCF